MQKKSFSLGKVVLWLLLAVFIWIYLDTTKEDREQTKILENYREDAIERDGVKYYLDTTTGEATVVGLVNDKFTKIEIKNVVEGCTVTKIQYGAFKGCNNLEEVSISNSVVEIEKYAFSSCVKLKSIKLPLFLEEVSDYCFENTGITDISIPPFVKRIGTSAFSSAKLTEVHIPGTVKEVGSFAFSNSSTIKKIVIDEGVTIISNNAFSYNLNLNSISFPDSVEEFGEEVLRCAALKKVRIPSKITEVHDNVFANIDELEIIELPEGCTILVGEGEKAVPIYAEIVYY